MSSSKRLEMLDKLIAKGSNDPFVWYGRAMELRSLGQLPQAVKAFETLTEKHPDYVPTYLMAGQVAQELGDHEAARSWMRTGIDVARRAQDAHTVSELEAALEALDS